jgi:acyl carrier protein
VKEEKHMATEANVGLVRSWTQQQVTALIHEIITDLSPSPGEIVGSARLVEDLGFHSLSLLELAFSLEDEFDLPTIDEPTARQILTVSDVEQHALKFLRANGQIVEA